MKKQKVFKRKLPTTFNGNLNRLIDQTFHPCFHKDKSYIIIDTALHFIVEQNLKQSTKKFLRYSLKYL